MAEGGRGRSVINASEAKAVTWSIEGAHESQAADRYDRGSVTTQPGIALGRMGLLYFFWRGLQATREIN
jgi:hypothetical protein